VFNGVSVARGRDPFVDDHNMFDEIRHR